MRSIVLYPRICVVWETLANRKEQNEFGSRHLPPCHISSKYIKFWRRNMLANSSTDDEVYSEQPVGSKFVGGGAYFHLSDCIIEFVLS
jgi:hypothetical protein